VLRRWRAPDGLNLAEVQWLAPAARTVVSAANAYLVDILRRLMPELGDVYQFVKTDFDDADWVGCRLAELLPVSLEDKQAWADMADPAARLDQLAALIRTPTN
jgi:Lon protease-like protein